MQLRIILKPPLFSRACKNAVIGTVSGGYWPKWLYRVPSNQQLLHNVPLLTRILWTPPQWLLPQGVTNYYIYYIIYIYILYKLYKWAQSKTIQGSSKQNYTRELKAKLYKRAQSTMPFGPRCETRSPWEHRVALCAYVCGCVRVSMCVRSGRNCTFCMSGACYWKERIPSRYLGALCFLLFYSLWRMRSKHSCLHCLTMPVLLVAERLRDLQHKTYSPQV